MILDYNISITVQTRNLKKIRQLFPTVMKNQEIIIKQKDAFNLNCSCIIIDLQCDKCKTSYKQSIGRLHKSPNRLQYCGKCISLLAQEKMKNTVKTEEYRKKKSLQTKSFLNTNKGRMLIKEKGKRHSEWIKKNPEKIKKWTNNLKHFYGSEHPNWNPNKSEFYKYSYNVRKLSEVNYKNNESKINPYNYKRTLCGIDDGYQLDHIKSIKYCFDNGISVEECSDISNLQLLPWKQNRTKW